MLVMEGWDAAGKGGQLRVTEHLDPRGFQVDPIGAPAPHENVTIICNVSGAKFHSTGKSPFLIAHGTVVLVERVEGFATKEEWMRAYDEINDFEKLLTDDHYIIGKFFYHISKEEQLKRFKDREKNPLKRWKITDEDWRNREKWDEYVEAMEDMFEKQVSQMRSGILLKVTINCMPV